MTAKYLPVKQFQPAVRVGKSYSLTRQTLLKIGSIIVLVTICTSLLSYFYLSSSMESQFIDQLGKYVKERGAREQLTFTEAQNNELSLKAEVLQRLADSAKNQSQSASSVEADFNQLMVRYPDGVLRNRSENYDGKRLPTVFLGPQAQVTPDLMKNVMLFYNLTATYGPAWHTRFQDTYIATPDNITVCYWPEAPTWAQDAKADYDATKLEWFYTSDPQHDPSRTPTWTGVYMDAPSKQWLVSVETPIDMNGKHFATIGQDITLNELIDRTINDHLNDSYNVVIHRDGRLIAHPEMMKAIQDKGGTLTVAQTGDAHLKRIYDKISANVDPTTGNLKSPVIKNDDDSEYLAVDYISEPNWYFISVVPKSYLTSTAFGTAQFILMLGVIALIIELVALFLIFRGQITRPLGHLTNVTERIANGDLTQRVNINKRDEIGRLAASFNGMVESLTELNQEIGRAGQELNGSAIELLAMVNQQTAGASEQVAAVQQTSATIHEVKSTIEQTGQKAWAISDAATGSITVAEEGQQVVLETISSMTNIKEQVESIAENILALSEQTQQIGEIIATVNDIAEQSNLLALNAAVEAARAGEHGRGFAVVANEVRNLAERSKMATNQVRTILSDIQKATNSVVMVTEEGAKGVDEGVKLVDKTGTTITQLSRIIRENQSNTQQILAVVQQQNVGLEQVAQSIMSISDVTGQNVASIRQLEERVQGMNRLSGRFGELTSRYQLDDQNRKGSVGPSKKDWADLN
ncbi:MAG TPA: methyl-accepting chemotaxis protein [Chloroflexia bacterium]|nr:methyl-accepting chemotaxis protein [Chloroflexia bacterium]